MGQTGFCQNIDEGNSEDRRKTNDKYSLSPPFASLLQLTVALSDSHAFIECNGKNGDS